MWESVEGVRKSVVMCLGVWKDVRKGIGECVGVWREMWEVCWGGGRGKRQCEERCERRC